MSFFPPEFDPRADYAVKLELINVNTPDGDFGFLLGADGRFVDVNGKTWIGSTLISGTELEMAIGGAAPSGTLTLTFFQDPLAPELVSEVRALGLDYVKGRLATFYIQPLRTIEEFYAPTIAPVQIAARSMTAISFQQSGPLQRSISLSVETPFVGRNLARGLRYTTADHSALIGSPNTSLRFMPTDLFEQEKLFG